MDSNFDRYSSFYMDKFISRIKNQNFFFNPFVLRSIIDGHERGVLRFKNRYFI